MPHLGDDDEAWRKLVEERIGSVLSELAEAFGPRVCQHGDYVDCELCEFGETQPKPGTMPAIADWAIVVTVESATTNDPVISLAARPGQRNHVTKGLLHTALFED